MQNCRSKLKGLQGLARPPDRFDDFINRLGHLPTDAKDLAPGKSHVLESGS